jgi:hypothetical protein
VRIALSEAVAHRVRSEKNQVIVEFDKADGRSAPYVMPPAGRDSAVVTPFDPSGVPARLDPIAALQLQGFASSADDPAPQSAPAAPGAQASAPAAPPATGQSTAPVVPIRPVFAAQPAASAAQIAAAQPAPAASQIAAAQPTAGPAPGPAPAPQNPAAPQSPPAAQNPPATAQPGTGQTLGGTDRRYTGSPVSFDFQDADLKSVLNVFAQEEGLNLLIDPGVQGTVNVHFTAVPWDQALDQILRANKLGYLVDGTIVRIAPIATLATEAEDRRKLADAQANEGELITMPRTLSCSSRATRCRRAARCRSTRAPTRSSSRISSRG